MSQFATLSDLKPHLNKQSSADDAELQVMLDAATEVVASYVGDYVSGAVSERVVARGGQVLLSRRPVVGDVTLTTVPGWGSLTGWDSITSAGGQVTGHTVDAASGVVYDVAACGPLTATYTVGASTVPAAVTLATVIIAGHLYETQRGVAPTPLAPDQGDEFALTPGLGFAIPNRAKELIEPYVRRSQVA
jgi:hypothetical protein